MTNYKNYTLEQFDFKSLNCITGKNGIGKSNVLDAVYNLAIGKSFFSSWERNVVRNGADFYRLEGLMHSEMGKARIVSKYQMNKGKKIEINDEALDRLSDMPGRYPIVMISPWDDRMIYGGSALRRRFLNNVLAQIDRSYVRALSTYHSLLKKRNATLKNKEMSYGDRRTLIMHYSHEMSSPANYIRSSRREIFKALKTAFKHQQQKISNRAEEIEIELSSWEGNLIELHDYHIEKDMNTTRTNHGVHRSDIVLKLGDERLKDQGSQGQIKTAVIALKLAQYECTSDQVGIRPIILMDDIFDRLDSGRVAQLLDLVISEKKSQVFLSHTEEKKVRDLLGDKTKDAQFIHLKKEQKGTENN